jgi:hypothetical protein
MTRIELIILGTEEEYKQEYLKVYVDGAKFTFWGVPLSFDEKSFEHIFYENDADGAYKKRFSERRAKRMHFMKAILDGCVETEVMYEQGRGTYAIFCRSLECVMFLRNREGTGSVQIGTFFDFGEHHTKMYEKQKKKCIPITPEEFRGQIK